MTNEAIEILKAARDAHKRSIADFRMYQLASESTDFDNEMISAFNSSWREADGMCDGLLKAYGILTGRKIYAHQIKEELERLA